MTQPFVDPPPADPGRRRRRSRCRRSRRLRTGRRRAQLRIGNQKGNLSLLKGRGTLEKRLAPLGVSIKWTEFTAGPVQLEALNVGSIDFGDVGEAPPIFAQAAGAPLAYVAATVPRPQSEAVLVPKGSAIQSVADLKGKKVALNKGSNVHYFLVKLLEKHGLAYGDVNVVFLPPADARAAFEKGSIDAWVIWDPFLAAAAEDARRPRAGRRHRRGRQPRLLLLVARLRAKNAGRDQDR